MSWISIDIECDGPAPGTYSMLSFGAVLMQQDLANAPTFYAELRPISTEFQPEALKVNGFTREQSMGFTDPRIVMQDFEAWIKEHGGNRPMMFADNCGDYMFITWYFVNFLGYSPLGHSSMNLGSLYKGMVKSTFKNFHHLRVTAHTHNALDDAKGNAEALLYLINNEGLDISLK